MPGSIASLTFCLIAAFFGAPEALRKRRSTRAGGGVEERAVQTQDLPGARAVFSQGALDYFARDILPVLVEDEIPRVQIPNINADEAGFRISMYNIRITNPVVERPAFRFAAGEGLHLELNDIKLNLRVNYHVDGKEWWNPINERGEASCRPTVWASATAIVGTAGGKPTISVANPSVRISMGNININHGIIGWLLELLIPIFQGEIESLVEREITKVVQDVVDKDLRGILDQLDLKVPVPVPPPFDNSGLHFNLTGVTAHSEHAVIDLQVGIVDPRTNRLVRQPVSSVIPDDVVDNSRMVSVSLAPEILEDIVRFHQGKWQHTIQAHEIPAESPLGLTTASLSLLTTPALGLLWGQKDMQLTFALDGDASIRFSEGAVDLSLPSAFKFDIKHDDAEPEHVFTLASPLLGNATARIRPEPDQAILIELESFNLTPLSTKEKHDSLWFVNTLVINPMLDFLENSVIMPEINKLLAGGVACCGLAEEKFALRRMTTRLSTGALSVFSDIDLDLRAILTPGSALYLQHADSGKCVHPNGGWANENNVQLIFHSGCADEHHAARLQFEEQDAGGGRFYLKSRQSGKCVHPSGGNANSNNVELIFHDGCDGSRLQFVKQDAGNGRFYLKHADTGRCVHPSGGQVGDSVKLVFHDGCGDSRLQFQEIQA